MQILEQLKLAGKMLKFEEKFRIANIEINFLNCWKCIDRTNGAIVME